MWVSTYIIETADSKPVCEPLYRIGGHLETEFRIKIEEYLKEGIIRKLKTPEEPL